MSKDNSIYLLLDLILTGNPIQSLNSLIARDRNPTQGFFYKPVNIAINNFRLIAFQPNG